MRRSFTNSFGNYLITKGWAHVVLLAGLCLFLFPFLWMLGMSVKTDEEVTNGELFPSLPTFRSRSPFVRETPLPVRPGDVSDSTWSAFLPTMLAASRASIQSDDDTLGDAASRHLTSQLIGRLDRSLWTDNQSNLIATFKQMLTPEAAAQSLSDRLARLELKQFQLRLLDGKIHNLTTGAEFARDWKVLSGPAKLVVRDQATVVEYNFASSSDPPIVLRHEFDFPGDPASLHKLIVAMKGDDSWHRVKFSLDVADAHWESDRTNYIAQHRVASLIFQPPTFDDQTMRPKKWTPLIKSARANASQRAVVTLTIQPSSTTSAIFGKVVRNYERAFHFVPFWTYVGNSVILVFLQVAGALLSSGFVAYAFARLNWPGRSIAMAILLATMMLPSQVTLIPSFMIWRSVGWYNTLNPLWVPAWFGSAFFIFLMTQNMKTIPRELEEAARIDGLNAIQTWWYIFMPLVKPTLAAIAVMVFMGAWNDFMGPLIMLRDQDKFPLSLGLFGMRVDSETAGVDWTMIMAGNVLMTLPVVLIFFFFQRYFIQGVTMTGMKG